ncbi:MAG: hypothetical protein F4030_02320 [Gammaproteobacteria bacterium]|nr:hypothetical protein [Gammaproteobacteria bacterium]MYH85303.1 hypothetical protein [Gammaproteobacteria bacterium]MYK03809.1 hypothetical protein [Gammaproteobacteria bacterium]
MTNLPYTRFDDSSLGKMNSNYCSARAEQITVGLVLVCALTVRDKALIVIDKAVAMAQLTFAEFESGEEA